VVIRATVKWNDVLVYADEVRSRIDPDSVSAAEIVREADGG
jgi:hypothetical protein